MPQASVFLPSAHLGAKAACGLLALACSPNIAAPCFDGTYDVELLDRVQEYSTCPAPWAPASTFRVAPKKISLRGARGECSQVALRLESHLPRNFTGLGTSFLTKTAAGAIEGRFASEDEAACPAWSSLEAHLPSESSGVAEAAAHDAVLWKMDVIDIDDTCGIPVPEGGRCTDVYRSRMTKIADWMPE
jgi:hypothetical protein